MFGWTVRNTILAEVVSCHHFGLVLIILIVLSNGQFRYPDYSMPRPVPGVSADICFVSVVMYRRIQWDTNTTSIAITSV